MCTAFTFAVVPSESDFELDNNGPVLPPLISKPAVRPIFNTPSWPTNLPRLDSIKVSYTCPDILLMLRCQVLVWESGFRTRAFTVSTRINVARVPDQADFALKLISHFSSDGVSPLHLTVTFKRVPSYDIYWRKACSTPTARYRTNFPLLTIQLAVLQRRLWSFSY